MEPTDITDVISGSMSFAEMGLRFAVDLLAILLLARGIYYRRQKSQKEYVFTYMLFNLVIFMTCLLLSSAKMKLGFAFGLFAIFSIMRYRTVVIPIKEMGFFFASVAMGIFNALVSAESNYALLIGANAALLCVVFALDRYLDHNRELHQEIVYEKIDLIKPGRKAELLADLQDRTGLPIHRVEIMNVDFLKDTATVHAFYKEGSGTV